MVGDNEVVLYMLESGISGLGREGEMIVDCLRVGEKGEELKV